VAPPDPDPELEVPETVTGADGFLVDGSLVVEGRFAEPAGEVCGADVPCGEEDEPELAPSEPFVSA
jgi:hypothetical protein